MWKRLAPLIRRALRWLASAAGFEVIPPTLPVLPLSNDVMFPGAILPLTVRSPSTIALLRDVIRAEGLLAVVAHQHLTDGTPTPGDLYPIATVVRASSIKQEEGGMSFEARGLARCRLTGFIQQMPYIMAELEKLPWAPVSLQSVSAAEALLGLTRRLFQRPGYASHAQEVLKGLSRLTPGHLADLIAANLAVRIQEKQRVLETRELPERLALVETLVRRELEGVPLAAFIPATPHLSLPAIPSSLPVLPLSNDVMFPEGLLPLVVRDPSCLALVRDADAAGGLMVVAARKITMDGKPNPVDLYPIATLVRVVRVKHEEGAMHFQVKGLARCRLTGFVQQTPYLVAKLEAFPEGSIPPEGLTAAAEELRGLARRLFQRPDHPPRAQALLKSLVDPGQLANLIAANLAVRIQEKQRVLETRELPERLALVKTLVQRELEGTPLEGTVPVHGHLRLPAIPSSLPVLPLSNDVLFPGGLLTLVVRDPSCLALVRDVDAAGGLMVVTARKNTMDGKPRPVDLYPIATLARVVRVEHEEGSTRVQAMGLARCRLIWFIQQTPYLAAKLEAFPEGSSPPEGLTAEAEELRGLARQLFQRPDQPPQAQALLKSRVDLGQLANLIAANLAVRVQEKQQVLETRELPERLALVKALVQRELEGVLLEGIVPVQGHPRLPAIPSSLPVLPLDSSVVFPGRGLSVPVRSPSSLALLKDADAAGGLVVLAVSRRVEGGIPRAVDLFPIATVARIARLKASADGTVTLMVWGLLYCRLTWFVQQTPYLAARIEVLPTGSDTSKEETRAEK